MHSNIAVVMGLEMSHRRGILIRMRTVNRLVPGRVCGVGTETDQSQRFGH